MSAKLALLAFLAVAPAVAATTPEPRAVWNVLPPRLSGHTGTLFFACKTPTGRGLLRAILADFTNGHSQEVPVVPEDLARLGQPYAPSLQKCAGDCKTTVFLARVPEDADRPYPKGLTVAWYNFSLFRSRAGKTERVGHFAIGDPHPPASGETTPLFRDLTVAPDGDAFLLTAEDDEYYFLASGDEHPSLILAAGRWGREYCGKQP